MANLIIVNDEYRNEDALENVVHYAINYDKTRGIIGGQGVLMDAPYSYMQQVKNHYGKNKGKQAQHFVLSFGGNEAVTASDAYEIGYKVCALLPEYQLVFGFHQGTEHPHIHWAVNPVSVLTGKKLIFGARESFDLRKRIAEILEPYGISCHLRMDKAGGV